MNRPQLRRTEDGLEVYCNKCTTWSSPIEASPFSQAIVVQEAERKLYEHLEAVHPTQEATALLTDNERRALTLSGELANLLTQIIGDGPTREQDTLEMHHHLHAIQRAIGSQAAARAYPDTLRLLGEVGSWNGRAEPPHPPPANPFEGDREQAHAMGLCLECGEGRYGHTFTVLCWWMRRWQQKDATW